jgi:hypothetical protein
MTTLKSLIERDGVRADVSYGASVPTPEDFRDSTAWTVVLRRKGRKLSVPFFTGSAITEDPTAHVVLDCVLSDALIGEDTFEGFASEFGYEEDSRKAYATWESCVKMARKVRKFLQDADTFEEYAYADRD